MEFLVVLLSNVVTHYVITIILFAFVCLAERKLPESCGVPRLLPAAGGGAAEAGVLAWPPSGRGAQRPARSARRPRELDLAAVLLGERAPSRLAAVGFTPLCGCRRELPGKHALLLLPPAEQLAQQRVRLALQLALLSLVCYCFLPAVWCCLLSAACSLLSGTGAGQSETTSLCDGAGGGAAPARPEGAAALQAGRVGLVPGPPGVWQQGGSDQAGPAGVGGETTLVLVLALALALLHCLARSIPPQFDCPVMRCQARIRKTGDLPARPESI